MGLNAGNLDRRIQLYRAERTRAPAGGFIEDWKPFGSPLPAARRDVSDAEKWANAGSYHQLQVRFQIRSGSFARSIRRSDCLTCDGEVFEIAGIKEMPGRRAFVELSCIAGQIGTPEVLA
ncbi:head-tail adaptor protein [Paroceanicella profunda]|uniref:Head-tail adaptor protein n=1 Tax=Paroceanicella profunda TaxID=2579971 RepID=A0A5B8FQ45_9RHOB|nr:head-tail adaptor protein [Paroceanicella profunda]QDL90465.1 head-tail adaptor protein [Paroceanicella profunda]